MTGGNLWLASDISPFIPTAPMRWPHSTAKLLNLKEVERSPRGAIYLSDGYINVALLIPRSDSTPKGLHHFGFEVDSVEATQKWLKQIKPDIEIQQPLPGVAFAEYKIKDPEGNTFDIYEKGWEV